MVGCALRIEEQDVVLPAEPSLRHPAAPVAPDDFILKLLRPEDGIHEQLQVVARRGVAMQVDAARLLEDSLQLHESRGHHRQVGEHVVLPEERAERAHRGAHGAAGLHDLLVVMRGRRVPSPGVGKRFDLGVRRRPLRLLEEDVVAGVRVERRVEVDQVDALILDVPTEHVQVVAVAQGAAHVRQATRRSGRA